MALTVYEQIMEYIKQSRRVVVALDKKISADTLGAAYSITRILERYEKQFQVTIEQSSDIYGFLTENMAVTSGLKQARRLVVTLDIREQGLDKFYYTVDEQKSKLDIYIVPKNGFFNPDDVRVGQGGFEYDLIITLGATDLNSLGSVYEGNAAFFHETPIINIDHRAANELFGEINLVEPTKSSTSEIVFDFMEACARENITQTVATSLLAGILERTESFRAPTLAPQTLEKAGRLMALKADRERIVRELFYNKSLPLMKLWGRVLARLKEDTLKRLYWSIIATDDYARAGAEPVLVDKVFEDVMRYLPREATILLFSEFNGAVMILAYSGNSNILLPELFAAYKPITFEHGVKCRIFGRDLLELEKEAIDLFVI